MLNIFRSLKKVKLGIINKLCELQARVDKYNIRDVSIKISRLINEVENAINIDKEAETKINQALKECNNRVYESSKEFMKYKLDYISKLLRGYKINYSNEYLASEKELYNKMDELTLLEEDRENCRDKRDNALGRNKAEWLRLNSSLELIESKYMQTLNVYEQLLTTCKNYQLAETTKDNATVAGIIDRTRLTIDDNGFIADNSFIKDVENDVSKQDKLFSNNIIESYSTNLSNNSYEKALEENRLKNVKKTGKKKVISENK